MIHKFNNLNFKKVFTSKLSRFYHNILSKRLCSFENSKTQKERVKTPSVMAL